MSTPESPSPKAKNKRWSGITRDLTCFSVGAAAGWFGNLAYLNHTNAIRTPAEREAATRALEASAKK